MAFTRVAHVQEVVPGLGKLVTINGRKIALFNVGGTICAIDDACPHKGASLAEGQIAGKEVVCPWHMARFDVTTGAHLSPPARSDVACFKVQVVGDEVHVEV
jgi:3-phenylpropionate/trans-cinnamate dioxygenase ferredoxin subunit